MTMGGGASARIGAAKGAAMAIRGGASARTGAAKGAAGGCATVGGAAGGARAGGGIGGIKANGGGAAKSSGSAGTTAAVEVREDVGFTTGAVIGGGESKWMGFCGVAPFEERAEGRAGVSSGNSGKGFEGLGTKVRFINEGPSAGGTGRDFPFEKNAFMEAVLAAANRG